MLTEQLTVVGPTPPAPPPQKKKSGEITSLSIAKQMSPRQHPFPRVSMCFNAVRKASTYVQTGIDVTFDETLMKFDYNFTPMSKRSRSNPKR